MIELTQEHKDCTWLLKIIDSCHSTVHFDYVDKLLELFSEKHPTEVDLLRELQQARFDKWNIVHNILV